MAKMTDETKNALLVAKEFGLLKTLGGLNICITGTLSVERNTLMWLIKELGGTNHGSVSNTTHYLVTPNENVRRGSKYHFAKQKAVPIITEEQFCKKLMKTPEELLA